jgi:hypothetical protein
MNVIRLLNVALPEMCSAWSAIEFPFFLIIKFKKSLAEKLSEATAATKRYFPGTVGVNLPVVVEKLLFTFIVLEEKVTSVSVVFGKDCPEPALCA